MKNKYATSILFLVLFVIFPFQNNAQQVVKPGLLFSLGLNAGRPTMNVYNYTIGADFRLQKDLNRQFAALLSLGYTEFQQGKGTAAADFGMVPIKLGTKFYPLASWYLSGEAGVAIQQYLDSKAAFIWSPGLGYAGASGLDVGLRYERSGANGLNAGQMAFRVAYNFSLDSRF